MREEEGKVFLAFLVKSVQCKKCSRTSPTKSLDTIRRKSKAVPNVSAYSSSTNLVLPLCFYNAVYICVHQSNSIQPNPSNLLKRLPPTMIPPKIPTKKTKILPTPTFPTTNLPLPTTKSPKKKTTTKKQVYTPLSPSSPTTKATSTLQHLPTSAQLSSTNNACKARRKSG